MLTRATQAELDLIIAEKAIAKDRSSVALSWTEGGMRV